MLPRVPSGQFQRRVITRPRFRPAPRSSAPSGGHEGAPIQRRRCAPRRGRWAHRIHAASLPIRALDSEIGRVDSLGGRGPSEMPVKSARRARSLRTSSPALPGLGEVVSSAGPLTGAAPTGTKAPTRPVSRSTPSERNPRPGAWTNERTAGPGAWSDRGESLFARPHRAPNGDRAAARTVTSGGPFTGVRSRESDRPAASSDTARMRRMGTASDPCASRLRGPSPTIDLRTPGPSSSPRMALVRRKPPGAPGLRRPRAHRPSPVRDASGRTRPWRQGRLAPAQQVTALPGCGGRTTKHRARDP